MVQCQVINLIPITDITVILIGIMLQIHILTIHIIRLMYTANIIILFMLTRMNWDIKITHI